MRLTRLIIENFRGFEQLELDLDQPVIVLVGINGSGKTTVLDAIADCLANTSPRPDDIAAETCRFVISVRTSESQDFELEFRHPSGPHPNFPQDGLVLAEYPVRRHASDETPSLADPPAEFRNRFTHQISFSEFFTWFRWMEDIENQDRRDQPDHRDPALQAVRTAIQGVLRGFTAPEVVRWSAFGHPYASLVVSKHGRTFTFNQFSEGERILIALAADIARRAALTEHVPVLEAPGVVLIDEIDLHLHPGWQREVLPRLMKTFPNVQFITTTHSPIVVASVPSESIRLLKDFQYIPVGKTEGRDPNAVLAALFEVSPRPKEIQGELREVAELIDGNKLTEARQRLDELSKKLGEDDDDVRRLDGLIELLAG